jgi:hypothetical protein
MVNLHFVAQIAISLMLTQSDDRVPPNGLRFSRTRSEEAKRVGCNRLLCDGWKNKATLS